METSFISQLIELRRCLIKSLVAIVIVFLCLLLFSNQLYSLLAAPLLRYLPTGDSLIAIGVAAPLLAPLKLTLVLSMCITIPYLLHQLWRFIAPGLYLKERRLVFPILLSSVVLFYAGIVFAYFVIFPVIFHFFVNTAPKGVAVMPDISLYLDFTLKLFLAFGIAFEIPVLMIILVLAKVTTLAALKNKRPYVIVGAFIVGMLLTPPDVVSQTLLAIPIWFLYEFGLIFIRTLLAKTTP